MIEMLDDNQLVEMVQHGDYRGFSELWKRYEKFVYSVLDGKHLLAYPNWRDDMLAEGRRGFFVAVKHFDSSRGYKLTTYAYDWILKYPFDLVNQLHKAEEVKKRLEEVLDLSEHPAYELSSKRQDVSNALESIAPRDAMVVRMYYGIGGREFSLDEIAAFMALSRERVRQLRDRALKDLRKPLMGYGDVA